MEEKGLQQCWLWTRDQVRLLMSVCLPDQDFIPLRHLTLRWENTVKSMLEQMPLSVGADIWLASKQHQGALKTCRNQLLIHVSGLPCPTNHPNKVYRNISCRNSIRSIWSNCFWRSVNKMTISWGLKKIHRRFWYPWRFWFYKVRIGVLNSIRL